MGFVQFRDEDGHVQDFYEQPARPPLDANRLAEIRRFVRVLDWTMDYRGQMLMDLLGEVDRLHERASAVARPAMQDDPPTRAELGRRLPEIITDPLFDPENC